MQTVVRTSVTVDAGSFLLAQGQDARALMSEMEQAAHAGGKFVSFVVVGDRQMSVFISSSSQIVFSVETIQYDANEDRDHGSPFGGTFDMDWAV
jgi:hypothetical protein